jgi:hypothetical protein
MTILAKAAAMLDTASPRDLDDMTPVEQARFADLMRHWWKLAEPPKPAPKRGGVLGDLKNGARSE